MNAKHCSESVATDTVYDDTHAMIIDVNKQFFVGTKTMFTDVYDMKNDNQFANTIEDCIHEHGAIAELISESTKVETSKCVFEIPRALCISNWKIEAYQ